MRVIYAFVLVALAFLVGCVETTFLLGPVEDGKVDPSLLGRWNFEDSSPDAKDGSTLDVSKFDEHRYRMVWTSHADGKLMRMAGHVAVVKGITFVHAGQIDDDGKVAEKHFLIRLDREGDDTITLSNLEPDFMATKKIDSDASLRTVIEASLDDPNLYSAEVLIGKRAK